MASPPSPVTPTPRRRVSREDGPNRPSRFPFRVTIGGVLALALILIAANTISAASGETAAGNEPSAIQLAQVYAEGCFYAIIAIGLGFAAYVGTRTQT